MRIFGWFFFVFIWLWIFMFSKSLNLFYLLFICYVVWCNVVENDGNIVVFKNSNVVVLCGWRKTVLLLDMRCWKWCWWCISGIDEKLRDGYLVVKWWWIVVLMNMIEILWNGGENGVNKDGCDVVKRWWRMVLMKMVVMLWNCEDWWRGWIWCVYIDRIMFSFCCDMSLCYYMPPPVDQFNYLYILYDLWFLLPKEYLFAGGVVERIVEMHFCPKWRDKKKHL